MEKVGYLLIIITAAGSIWKESKTFKWILLKVPELLFISKDLCEARDLHSLP